jgi:hypothetical protein
MKSVFLISLLFFTVCANQNKEKQDAPSVIFIMLDDFGYSQIAYNSEQISAED